jgi:hypothetical protein
MRKLTIDRRTWLRGEGKETSYLLRRADQKQCCVGFYLEACGVPRDILVGNEAAHSPEVGEILPEEAKWLNTKYIYSTPDARCLYGANDSRDLSEEDREAIIKEIFLKHDVEVEFIN